MPGILVTLAAVALGRLAFQGQIGAPVVAGPGWVRWGRSTWSVADSVLLIDDAGPRNAEATLVGPAGILRIRLQVYPAADGQLATLWTRWMHPHPEPAGLGLDDG